MSDSRRWIDLAKEDEKMAELALKAKLYNQVCFHCQQGAEKLFKAFLLKKKGKFPKIHSLTELLILASGVDKDLTRLKNDCLYLDQFYVPTRYPDAPLGNLPEGEPQEKDGEKAMEILAKLINLLTKKLPE